MNLFFLQLKEELRRLRILLPVWGACLTLASVWACLHATRPIAPNTPNLFDATGFFMFLLVLLPGAMLAKSIGLTDAAFAPDAAWAPRPLRGGVLASAKVATVILVILVPAAIAESIVVLLLFGPATLPAVWGYYATFGLAGCMSLVAVGALSGSWERFVLLAVLALALLFAAAWLADRAGVMRFVDPSLIASRLIITSWVAGLGGIALLFHVFVRRRMAEGYVLAFGIYFVCLGVFLLGPWNIHAHPPVTGSPAGRIDITPITARITDTWGRRTQRPEEYLLVELQITGAAPDWIVSSRRAAWRTDSRKAWNRGLDALPVPKIRTQAAAPEGGEYIAQADLFAELTPALREALQASGGELELAVEIDFFRTEQTASLPFNGEGAVRADRLRVAKTGKSGWFPGHVAGNFLITAHQPLFDLKSPFLRRWNHGSFHIELLDQDGPRPAGHQQRNFYLDEIGQNEQSLLPFAFVRRQEQASFRLRTDEPNGVQILSGLEEARFVPIYNRYLGTVVREIRVIVEKGDTDSTEGERS